VIFEMQNYYVSIGKKNGDVKILVFTFNSPALGTPSLITKLNTLSYRFYAIFSVTFGIKRTSISGENPLTLVRYQDTLAPTPSGTSPDIYPQGG
jgi:hypothetical protein